MHPGILAEPFPDEHSNYPWNGDGPIGQEDKKMKRKSKGTDGISGRELPYRAFVGGNIHESGADAIVVLHNHKCYRHSTEKQRRNGQYGQSNENSEEPGNGSRSGIAAHDHRMMALVPGCKSILEANRLPF